MGSLISNDKRCVICGDTRYLHRHHIYPGTANRKKSEEDGCWVWLCPAHHNMGDSGVHNDKDLDRRLKALCQIEWEETYGSREDFIKRFGRNYI